jgi:hypothetical protein
MTKPERHDTAENLLSPEAVERALAGKASKEKAQAFQERLQDNPDARQALERFNKLGDTQNPRHSGLQRLEQSPSAVAPRAAGAQPPAHKPTRNQRLFFIVALALLLLLLGLLTLLLTGALDSAPSKPNQSADVTASLPKQPSTTSTVTPTATSPLTGTPPTPSALPVVTTPAPTALPSATTSSPQPKTSAAPAVTSPQPTSTPTSKLFFPDQNR